MSTEPTHDTTVTSGRDPEFGSWAEWVCTCGASGEGLVTKADARKRARTHEVEA